MNYIDDGISGDLVPLLLDSNGILAGQTEICSFQRFSTHHNNVKNEAKLKLFLAMAICFAFMIIEIIGGHLAGSLAIMTDAAHLLSDCISFIVGLISIYISDKAPDQKMSFGYRRVEVFGVILSITGIWLLSALLCFIAIKRLITNQYEIDADAMITVSSLGIAINIIIAIILHGPFAISSKSKTCLKQDQFNCDQSIQNEIDAPPDFIFKESKKFSEKRQNSFLNSSASKDNIIMKTESRECKHKNLNLQAAIIHVFGDLLQSVGVLAAAIIIKIYPNAKYMDPICTLLFSVVVLCTTVKIFKQSFSIMMNEVPRNISLKNLENDIKKFNGIISIHNLHLWSETMGHNVMMAHIVIDNSIDSQQLLSEVSYMVQVKYNVQNCALQIESIT